MSLVRLGWIAGVSLVLAACATVRPSSPAPAEDLRLKYRITVSGQQVRVQLEARGRPGERLPFQVPSALGAEHDFRIVSETWPHRCSQA